jgi:hypothetical protein
MVIFEVVWPPENLERYPSKEAAEERAREVSRTPQPNNGRVEVFRVEEDNEGEPDPVGRTIPTGISAWRGGDQVPM